MTSIVFPGQGSQYFGMCKEFYDNFKISQNLFNEIEEITSVPIKKIIFEDDTNNINLTKFTQICIFATSMSIFKVIEENIDCDWSRKGHIALACKQSHYDELPEYAAWIKKEMGHCCSRLCHFEEGHGRGYGTSSPSSYLHFQRKTRRLCPAPWRR